MYCTLCPICRSKQDSPSFGYFVMNHNQYSYYCNQNWYLKDVWSVKIQEYLSDIPWKTLRKIQKMCWFFHFQIYDRRSYWQCPPFTWFQFLFQPNTLADRLTCIVEGLTVLHLSLWVKAVCCTCFHMFFLFSLLYICGQCSYQHHVLPSLLFHCASYKIFSSEQKKKCITFSIY